MLRWLSVVVLWLLRSALVLVLGLIVVLRSLHVFGLVVMLRNWSRRPGWLRRPSRTGRWSRCNLDGSWLEAIGSRLGRRSSWRFVARAVWTMRVGQDVDVNASFDNVGNVGSRMSL